MVCSFRFRVENEGNFFWFEADKTTNVLTEIVFTQWVKNV